MFLFPHLVAGKGLTRAVTDEVGAQLVESERNRLAPPTEHLFRLASTPPTVFQGYGRLKCTPLVATANPF